MSKAIFRGPSHETGRETDKGMTPHPGMCFISRVPFRGTVACTRYWSNMKLVAVGNVMSGGGGA